MIFAGNGIHKCRKIAYKRHRKPDFTMQTAEFQHIIRRNQQGFHRVVDFDPTKDHLLLLDFTAANKSLTKEIIEDVDKFSEYINHKLLASNYRFGIGGYDEHRTVYSRSKVFDADKPGEEPRR